ncbi:hypothetical protein DFJ74DRAFT_460521 [Hyaloraphidium curvatum]|nr:hypothetical protein DFJ74DRAFT_460521 [Hyaloraphidium curvatum]
MFRPAQCNVILIGHSLGAALAEGMFATWHLMEQRGEKPDFLGSLEATLFDTPGTPKRFREKHGLHEHPHIYVLNASTNPVNMLYGPSAAKHVFACGDGMRLRLSTSSSALNDIWQLLTNGLTVVGLAITTINFAGRNLQGHKMSNLLLETIRGNIHSVNGSKWPVHSGATAERMLPHLFRFWKPASPDKAPDRLMELKRREETDGAGT